MSGSAWTTFERRMAEIADLRSMATLLLWDDLVVCPPRGREARGAQLATLHGLIQEKVCAPAYGEAIEAADEGSEGPRAAMLREARRERERALRLPIELVEQLQLQGSRANRAWEAGRATRDFTPYRPELERLIALKIEQADALGHGGERYDALLEGYEPGLTLARLAPVLAALEAALVPLAARLQAEPPPDRSFLDGPYDHAGQLALAAEIVRELGFDGEAGREDRSTHPFCLGVGPTDVRMTTRVRDTLEPGCLMACLHECGHALYEQGLPLAYARTSIGHEPSVGLHESQSRFWENVIGRSAAFWERYLPRARAHFPAQLEGVGVERFVRGISRVAATPIRVEADEVTYNLHIVLRVELEVALLRGDLAVADLPEAWRSGLQRLLGIEPVDDVEGVLQDIQWSMGDVGYFPTYTLGNLHAAALAERMARDLDRDALVRAGDFAPVLGWLREHVHARGAEVSTGELLCGLTGSELDHRPFLRHLEARYLPLYGLG